MGLAAVALLALVGQNALLLNANQKQEDTSIAADVGQAVAEEFLVQVRRDIPVGRTQAAYDQNSVATSFDSGVKNVSGTDYEWELFLSDVLDNGTGQPVGTGPTGVESTTKLKQMEIRVTWWGQNGDVRQGVGKTELKLPQLIKVSVGAP